MSFNLVVSFREGLKTIIKNGMYNKIMEESYGAGKVSDSARVKYSEIK